MLSPSPLLHGQGQQSSWKQECESLVCSATDFNQMLCVSSRGGGASDGESGFSWMEDGEEKGGAHASCQLRTVVVLVPADGEG